MHHSSRWRHILQKHPLLTFCASTVCKYSRFIKFCCVGAANFLVDFCCYLLLSALIPIYPSRGLSWAIACLFSYAMNKRWTFQARDTGLMPLVRFVVVNLCSLSLGLLMLYIFTALNCGRVTAYLLTLPFTLTTNYLGYRFWSFKHLDS